MGFWLQVLQRSVSTAIIVSGIIKMLEKVLIQQGWPWIFIVEGVSDFGYHFAPSIVAIMLSIRPQSELPSMKKNTSR